MDFSPIDFVSAGMMTFIFAQVRPVAIAAIFICDDLSDYSLIILTQILFPVGVIEEDGVMKKNRPEKILLRKLLPHIFIRVQNDSLQTNHKI